MYTESLTKCSVFWDIENLPVPRGILASDFVKSVRNLIRQQSWSEVDFTIACDTVNMRPQGILKQLHLSGASIFHVPTNVKNAADDKIKELLVRFVDDSGNNRVAIVLISGDHDFTSVLRGFKRRHQVTIYLIHNDNVAQSLIDCVDRSIHVSQITSNLTIRPWSSNKPNNPPLSIDPWLVQVTGYPTNVRNEAMMEDIERLMENKRGKFIENRSGGTWLSFPEKEYADSFIANLRRSSHRGLVLHSHAQDSRQIFNQRKTVNQTASEVVHQGEKIKHSRNTDGIHHWLVKVTGYPAHVRNGVIRKDLGSQVKAKRGTFVEIRSGVAWLRFPDKQDAVIFAANLNGTSYRGTKLQSHFQESRHMVDHRNTANQDESEVDDKDEKMSCRRYSDSTASVKNDRDTDCFCTIS